MPNFLEFEISDFRGIASSTRHPQKNECQECKNFDTRYIDGDLTLRPGFSTKYAAPVSDDHRGKLSSISYLEFENFYVPEGGGQEITIRVAKATLVGETGVANATPDNRNILAIFASHQFNGTSWVAKRWNGTDDGVYWLNHTIVTSLSTSSTDNECELDFVDANIISGNILNGWTIINITKSPYEIAQVIDTYDWGTNNVGVKITNNAHSWSSDDTIVLMKNYIPYDSLLAMYSCTSYDVTFHKVLNDLRIGFGGQENRLGLSVGYRRKAFLIGDIDWDGGAFDSFIEPLASINNLIITPYYPVAINNTYKIDISVTTGSGDELVAGKYFFLLTAVLDGFNQTLVAKAEVTISTAADLVVRPKIKLGPHNPRITKVILYAATTNASTDELPTNPYFLLQEYELSADTYSQGAFIIDETGEISTPIIVSEIHTDNNAAINEAPDYDLVGGFTNYSGLTISSDGTNFVTGIGTHSIKALNNTGALIPDGTMYLTQTDIFKKNVRYTVSFYAMSSIAGKTLSVGVLYTGGGVGEFYTFNLPTSFGTAPFSFTFVANEDVNRLYFSMSLMGIASYFNIDALSIIATTQDVFTSIEIPASDGVEVSDAMGYLPTFDMVKSWDQAIVTSGRTFFVNPYIDKRWENKIFRSHISGAGAFMYDVASAEGYIDLENFDGNSLIGVEVLPNLQFLALKTNGSQRIDPDTGATREIALGAGCISRKSIVNFGDRVVWCGENDIYMSDGLNTISIAEKTIREEYRNLLAGIGTNKILAVREEMDSSYRLLMPVPAFEKEYILTKKGWISRLNAGSVIADAFSNAEDGSVWFMDAGIIYGDSAGVSLDDTTTLTASWKSVEIDAELLGESLTERDFILLNSVWLDFTVNDNPLLDISIALKIYIDGSLYKTFTHLAYHVGLVGVGRQKFFNQFFPKSGRRFYIEASVSGTGVFGRCVQIHSAGVMWKPSKAGFYN